MVAPITIDEEANNGGQNGSDDHQSGVEKNQWVYATLSACVLSMSKWHP